VKYDIQVKDHAARAALVIKGKVKIEQAGEAIGGNIGAVSSHLEKAKLQPAGAPFTRTFQFADGVLEFEAGFPLAKAATSQGNLVATELPKATVATTVHVGDQATSENAYNAIHAWMKANGKQPAGAPWEVYVADDRMEIYFPIR
jgi:effector-binding domain-containing protein